VDSEEVTGSTVTNTYFGGSEMSIEYHGWVVLATSQDDWSDDDFENGYEGVAEVIERLCPDEGHEPLLPDCDVLPRVLYLKGSQVESLDLVFRAMEEVGALFDRAYGELTVLKEGDLDSCWDSSVVRRCFLVDGKLTHGG